MSPEFEEETETKCLNLAVKCVSASSSERNQEPGSPIQYHRGIAKTPDGDIGWPEFSLTAGLSHEVSCDCSAC